MQQSRMLHPCIDMADFGMALPYFVEIVEFNEVNVFYGPRVARSPLGQAFGERAVVVTGVTVDGQSWRAIYPHETSDCWVIADPYAVQSAAG